MNKNNRVYLSMDMRDDYNNLDEIGQIDVQLEGGGDSGMSKYTAQSPYGNRASESPQPTRYGSHLPKIDGDNYSNFLTQRKKPTRKLTISNDDPFTNIFYNEHTKKGDKSIELEIEETPTVVRAKRLHKELALLQKQLENGEKEPAVLKFLFDETINKAFEEE